MLLSPSQNLRFPAVERLRQRAAVLSRRIRCSTVRTTASSGSAAPAPTSRDSRSFQLSQSSSSPVDVTLGFRRDQELGLASVLFVISMVLGSFFSLVIISLPALHAFRKLASSSAKLSRVACEEVPGTLFSLKLSGLEINDLTRQLSSLKLRITGDHYVKKENRSIPGFREGRSDSAIR